ncbi:MAG: SRPBCC domain-containing protein [Devosia sp.]
MSENIVTAKPGESWFSIERSFEAPARLIWKCYTEPQHLAHFWGPRNAKTVSTVDLRVGGVWRTHWTYENGTQFGYSSVYLELGEPKFIHYRDAPGDWPGGLEGLPPVELLSTISLTEKGGRTTMIAHVECASVAARDETVRRGFAGMVSTGNDRLADYLETIKTQGEA